MKKSATLLVAILLVFLSAIAALVFFHSKPKPHTVKLTWHSPAGLDSSRVHYNVYRGTSSGGPYAKIASQITRVEYTDGLVVSGRTYFYVVTTIDANNRESRYSSETQAEIP